MWAMAKCIEEHLDHTAERPAKFSDRNSMEWVQPSIKFLEKKYSTYMFRMTQKNEPCSIPAIVFDVTKEFTKIVLKPNLHKTSSSKFDNSFSNLVMINDDIPIWALLYYIFRSGNLKLLRGIIESDLLVLKCTSQESIGQFIRLLQEYDGQKFNSTLIQHQCQPKKISDADDPFYAILYSILSKSNVDHPGFKDIINTSEDYLWLKLHQVRFAKTPSLPKSELLTLLTPSPMAPYLNFDLFQWSIFDGHGFDRTLLSENPMLGFLYLFLSCQYEAALLYLYRTKAYRIHAVYLTIAMLKQGKYYNPMKVLHCYRNSYARVPVFVSVIQI
ncbi:nuclear pore complex protein Nup93-like [Diaphorina citri]|uniref:Nuclear pore protein n=1 Tax=Diaphorina citri TaxID=121845 RepID=A0A3Q0IQ43_DIACI|nr:nuclear pore complex protein Nup93-like [Diaphorina citri]